MCGENSLGARQKEAGKGDRRNGCEQDFGGWGKRIAWGGWGWYGGGMMSGAVGQTGDGGVRVSVIIPCEGRACLAECLKSIEECGGVEGGYEVLVAGRMPAGMAAGGNVRLLESAEEMPGALRNLGAREARGEVLLFTDSDCTVDRGWLARAAVSCNERTPLVLGGIRFPRGSLRDTGVNLALYSMVHVSQGRGRAEGWRCGANNLAVRREIFRALGGFSPVLPHGEAEDFLERAEVASCPIWFDPRFAVSHRGGRTTGEAVRRHARHCAEATIVRYRSQEGRMKPHHLEDAFRGIPLVAQVVGFCSATSRLLFLVLTHPVFFAFAGALPWTWLFFYCWRRDVFRLYSALSGRER